MPNPRTIEDILSQYTVDERGCWVWTRGCLRDGYGRAKYRGKMHSTHRLSYAHHVGPIPDGLYVLHDCDQPACINPKHLYVGTQLENMADMERRCRAVHVTGEAHYRAKLTEEVVRLIRTLRGRGLTQKAIGALFGVTRFTISDILRGKTWRLAVSAERIQ